MKKIVTKCLVMGALAIGMSSTAMAEEEVVKSTPAGKFKPMAFEMTEGENIATALLLVGLKGDVQGVMCYNNPQVVNLADDCHRVEGKISQYDGSNHVVLAGRELRQGGIGVNDTIITAPIADPIIVYPTIPSQMHSIQAGLIKGATASMIALHGEATPIHGTYKGNIFYTPRGQVPYQPATQAIVVGAPGTTVCPICF